MIRNLLLLFLLTGCSQRREEMIRGIEEQSAFIVMIILFSSIAFLALTPKIQKWDFSRKLMVFFIDKLSLIFIFIMIVLAILFFNDLPIGRLISINLFVTSAFLYQLRDNYHNKDDATKLKDTRYFTVTLPSIVALVFLYSGGLRMLFG